ncbi:MAG: hypothetical protein JO159_18775 [Acidobacteria bacterium]|nr:hypothetical protein [Acidobacteriota bacterium]MBV9623349.1 hypothetical protein [Acidobacteriota bacterium]
MLNVCSPSPDEQQEISSALSRIPRRPSFSVDFEVDRGRSILDANLNPLAAGGTAAGGGPSPSGDIADFVRLRRELAKADIYGSVQYSFSRDRKQMVETLVFRVREPKDLLQVAIENSASAITTAAAMLGSASPAGRIKLERYGKSSVVLARCGGVGEAPAPDQSRYEPLFAAASSILSDYRGLLGARTLVPEELNRVGRSAPLAARGSKAPNGK